MNYAKRVLKDAVTTERQYINGLKDDIVFYKFNKAGRSKKSLADKIKSLRDQIKTSQQRIVELKEGTNKLNEK